MEQAWTTISSTKKPKSVKQQTNDGFPSFRSNYQRGEATRKQSSTIGGKQSSTRGERQYSTTGSSARTMTSLTAHNLSKNGFLSTLESTYGPNVKITTRDPLNDDLFSHFGRTRSYQDSVASSLATFIETLHASKRMVERKVSKREVSRVIKNGKTESFTDGLIVVALDDLVVVLALEHFNTLRNLPITTNLENEYECEGENWRRSSKKIVTVYRRSIFEDCDLETEMIGFTDSKMFSTWWKLYQHISSTLPEHDDSHPLLEPPQFVEEPSWTEFEAMLEDALVCHGKWNFLKVINWVRPTDSDPNFGFARSFEISLLSRACVYGFPNIVRLLRQYGANPCLRNSHSRHCCTPLQSMLTLDRWIHFPWRTSEKDVETIHALLGTRNLQKEETEIPSKCINEKYRKHSTFKRAVFFGDQSIIDCLLGYGCVDLTIHDNDENKEPISLVARYGGLRITLDQNLQDFYPKLQVTPEGYSVLSLEEIPNNFKLGLASKQTKHILGVSVTVSSRKQGAHFRDCESDPHLDWTEAILGIDQPSNMWGRSHAVEEQWVRIYQKKNFKSSQLNALRDFPSKVYPTSARSFGEWKPCTDTKKGNASTFRFYRPPQPMNETSIVSSHFVIIGQSLNDRLVVVGETLMEREPDELALRKGSFLCYLEDEQILVNRECHPSEATIFELIPA
jgi:hypothetical protein